jgi:hypothetical protein
MDKVVILKIKTVPCEEKTWIHRSAVQCMVYGKRSRQGH